MNAKKRNMSLYKRPSALLLVTNAYGRAGWSNGKLCQCEHLLLAHTSQITLCDTNTRTTRFKGSRPDRRLVRSLFIVPRLFRCLRSVQKCPESRTTKNPRGDPPRELPAGKALGRGNCALSPLLHSYSLKIDAAIYLRHGQIKTIDVKLIRRCNSAQSTHTRTYAIVFNISACLQCDVQ